MKNEISYLYFQDIADSVTIESDKIVTHALPTDDGSKIFVMGLDAGQNLSEHVAQHPASIQILKGEAELHLGGRTKMATAGSLAWMPANLPHSIEAKTQVVMLLTMFVDANSKIEA